MAVDLFIHTFHLTHFGTLDDVYLHPFSSPIDTAAGSEPQEGIASALEVLHSTLANLTVVQQRSPVLSTFTKKQVHEVIVPFIKEAKFAKVVILDSSDAGLVEHVTPGAIDLYTNEDLLYRSLESLKLQEKQFLLAEHPYRHSQYARVLVEALNGSKDGTGVVDLNVLVAFVYEGDNFYDGHMLAQRLAETLEMDPVKTWVQPVSWLGAYGDKPVPSAMEDGIFG